MADAGGKPVSNRPTIDAGIEQDLQEILEPGHKVLALELERGEELFIVRCYYSQEPIAVDPLVHCLTGYAAQDLSHTIGGVERSEAIVDSVGGLHGLRHRVDGCALAGGRSVTR